MEKNINNFPETDKFANKNINESEIYLNFEKENAADNNKFLYLDELNQNPEFENTDNRVIEKIKNYDNKYELNTEEIINNANKINNTYDNKENEILKQKN